MSASRFSVLNSVDFQSDKDSKEDINKVFALFDDNNTGVITLEHLKRVARELGEEMSEVHSLDLDSSACVCATAVTGFCSIVVESLVPSASKSS